jgi:hypothetical protein
MKESGVIIATFILVFGTVASRAANADRISAATGIPVATLQAERASTGLGWGQLGERASAGERHWPELRQHCRAASRRARLG